MFQILHRAERIEPETREITLGKSELTELFRADFREMGFLARLPSNTNAPAGRDSRLA